MNVNVNPIAPRVAPQLAPRTAPAGDASTPDRAGAPERLPDFDRPELRKVKLDGTPRFEPSTMARAPRRPLGRRGSSGFGLRVSAALRPSIAALPIALALAALASLTSGCHRDQASAGA